MSTVHDIALDRFKGILICLIVLGHNYIFSSEYPRIFSCLYGFHVVSFLLFPYLFLQARVSTGRLRTKCLALLTPHFYFVLAAAVFFFGMHVLMGPISFSQWLEDLGITLLVQRETLFRANLGAGFLWFLPALALQVALLFVYQNGGGTLKWLFISVALLFHLCLGIVDLPWLYQLPFSFSLVGYISILGFLANFLHRRIPWKSRSSLVVVCGWLVCSWLAIDNGFFHTLAGDMPEPPVSILQPVELLAQDGLIILSFFALLRVAYLVPSSLLGVLGRHSLQLFLLHPFVWLLLWQAVFKHEHIGDSGSKLFVMLISYLMTLVVTLALVKLIERTPVQHVIFPGRAAEREMHHG